VDKPDTCLDKKCIGNGGFCQACIHRSEIAKKGYELCRIVECIPASKEQTAAIVAVQEYVKFVESHPVVKGGRAKGWGKCHGAK